MTTPEITVGQGVLPVSRGLTEELFPDLLKIADCTVQGELKTQGIFEQVHRMLLLPASWTILGIFYSEWMSYYRGAWSIVVESPDIPQADEGNMLPVITPIYSRDADGTAHLLRIDLSQ